MLKRHSMIVGLITIIVGMLLASCNNANRNSIFRKFSLDHKKSIAIDAHQRAIISSRRVDSRGSRVVYCAEPSPDAFASIFSTIGFKLGKQGDSDNQGLSVDSNLVSIASNALNARNATIQLLRDGLYRGCEAYAAGALTSEQYLVALRQYQDMIIALLSIELVSVMVKDKQLNEDMTDTIGIISSLSRQLVEDVLERGDEKLHGIRLQNCFDLLSKEDNTEAQTSLIRKNCDDMLIADQDRTAEAVKNGDEESTEGEDIVSEAIFSLLGASPHAVEFVSDDIPEAPQDGAQIKHLQLGQSVETTFRGKEDKPLWLIFTADTAGMFEITANAQTGSSADPALKLYKRDDLEEIDADDDGGFDTNARIEYRMDPGEYLLRLFEVSGRGGHIEVIVNRQ